MRVTRARNVSTGRPPTTRRSPGRQLLALVVLAVTVAFTCLLGATAASAAETDCINSGYACTPGYTGVNANPTWAGKYYGNSIALTANGTHNCTLYAAWRLQQSGLADPGRSWGNAAQWASSIGGGNHIPAVGSIAWWGTERGGGYGHVAYVEQVSGSQVYVRADNFVSSGGYTTAGWISASSVDLFLHPHDAQSATAAGGNGTLFFLKTKNTGSGRVEIHSATPSSAYQNGTHAVTWFSPSDADNGWFQMVGSDLFFIKTKHTGSGRVEVHSATAGSGYQSGSHAATAFSVADADNGWFQMDGGDLVFIKTKNTGSGRVEYFRASAGSGYQQVVTATATAFSPADASNGWFQSQAGDLVFIKTRNTGTGRVEYFRASRSSGYRTVVTGTGTAFSPSDQNNGWFSSEDVNRDGRADLVFVKTHNPGSGHVEFFVADGSRNFQQVTSANVTWLSPADADNGWFLVDSKQ